MTSLLQRSDAAPAPSIEEPGIHGPRLGGAPSEASARPARRPLTAKAIVLAVALWLVVTAVVMGLAWYGLGPLLQSRDQRSLLDDLRIEIDQAANEQVSLAVDDQPINAPTTGDPVAVVDIQALELRQVAVEGVGPTQTRRGLGHVPGTAGPGQPGNAALVGRRATFGGPFGALAALERGDEILVTTVQGQSLYAVRDVRTTAVATGRGTVAGEDGDDERATAPARARLPDGPLTTDDLYAPTDDDRLTLVTSASRAPWASDQATVVVAALRGEPFEPTPQGGRTAGSDGRSADGASWPLVVLALLAYVAVIVGAVMAMRWFSLRTAYLLVAPPLVVSAILLSEATLRLLPAWA